MMFLYEHSYSIDLEESASLSHKHSLMAIDGFALEEVKPIDDSSVIRISLDHVGVACSKVRSDEAESGVIVLKPDADRTLVPGHPAQPSLNASQVSNYTILKYCASLPYEKRLRHYGLLL